MAQVLPIPLQSIPAVDISDSYTELGTEIVHPLRVFKLTNTTDGDMIMSLDGVNNHFFLPSASFTLYDLSTNAVQSNVTDGFQLPINTQFYVKYNTEPTEGSVWLEGLYAKGE